MRLQQMKKNLNKRLQNKKIIMNPTIATQKSKDLSNLKGMSGMDAVALLGNLGLKEKVIELES
jgi:cell division protein FtsI (penicillin-binding protein 3)